MNKSQIIDLYSYDDWANKKLLNAVSNLENEEFVRDLSSSFKSIRDTMVHVLSAEELWLSRWLGEQGRTQLNPDNFKTYTSLADCWENLRSKRNNFLLSLTEEALAKEISFKTLKGVSYSLELWKQMLHVTNHSTYHRGQIVTMLRQLKKQPPSLDLISYYLREG
ncbi:MAG: DinB family protein [Desulfosporosinus sp.]|nr:DinB family protein [Desulfosporosinus sp.]